MMRHQRAVTVALFVALLYMVALNPALWPQQTGSIQHVSAVAAACITLCAAAMCLCRLLPGVDSWVDLTLRYPASVPWRTAVLLTGAASLGYVVVQIVAQAASGLLVTRDKISALVVPDTSEIPADVVRSIHTAVLEEMLFFALPVAVGALIWRTVRGNRWLSVRTERAMIAALTGTVVVATRAYGHLWMGFPAVLVTVLPWMAGAWFIFRMTGTVWPLIIGHVIYDVFVFGMGRSPDSYWPLAGGLVFTAAAGAWAVTAKRTRRMRRQLAGARPPETSP